MLGFVTQVASIILPLKKGQNPRQKLRDANLSSDCAKSPPTRCSLTGIGSKLPATRYVALGRAVPKPLHLAPPRQAEATLAGPRRVFCLGFCGVANQEDEMAILSANTNPKLQEERKAAENAKAIVDTLTPSTARSDRIIFVLRYAANLARTGTLTRLASKQALDDARIEAATSLNAVCGLLERGRLTQDAIDQAASGIAAWLEALLPSKPTAENNSAERRGPDATSFHVGHDDPPVRPSRIAAQWRQLFARRKTDNSPAEESDA